MSAERLTWAELLRQFEELEQDLQAMRARHDADSDEILQRLTALQDAAQALEAES